MDDNGPRSIGRVFLVLVIVSALLAVAAGRSVSALPKAPADPAIVKAFVELQEYIAGLPATALKKGARNSLGRKAGNAEAAYRRGQPCTASNILGAYLNEAQALSRGGVWRSRQASTTEACFSKVISWRAFPRARLAPPSEWTTSAARPLGPRCCRLRLPRTRRNPSWGRGPL